MNAKRKLFSIFIITIVLVLMVACPDPNPNSPRNPDNTIEPSITPTPKPEKSSLIFVELFTDDIEFPTGHDVTDGFTAYSKIENTFGSFLMAQCELSYNIWNKVYEWAIDKTKDHDGDGNTGDDVYNITKEGNGGYEINADFSDETHPVSTITWNNAIVFSNAATEYFNQKIGKEANLQLKAVYRFGSNNILRDATITNDIPNYFLDDNSTTQDPEACTADGFRLPTMYEWEMAARYYGDDNHGRNDLIEMSDLYWYKGFYLSGAIGTDLENQKTVADFLFSGSDAKTSSIGSFDPSNMTLDEKFYDISGNLSEYTVNLQIDSSVDAFHYVRGGSFVSSNTECHIDISDFRDTQNGLTDLNTIRFAKYPTKDENGNSLDDEINKLLLEFVTKLLYN